MGDTTEELEEFEIINSPTKLDEVIIYRDIDDIMRQFVEEKVFRRFHVNPPSYAIHLRDNIDIYEVNMNDAYFIIKNANNKYAPYEIRYKTFDFRNDLVDEEQKDIFRQPVKDTIQIYRDLYRSEKTFVTKDVLIRFNLEKKYPVKVLVTDFVVYEIDPIDAINIINNATNPYAPYNIQYVALEFEKPIPYDESRRQEIPIPYYEKIIPYEEKGSASTKRKNRIPRPRMEGETDEMYVAYLEDLFDNHQATEEQTQTKGSK